MDSNKLQIIKYLQENPTVPVIDVAKRFSCTKAYVYLIIKNEKIQHKPKRKTHKTAPRPAKDWLNHFGSNTFINPQLIGGASELLVCVDLIKRGFSVFRSIAFTNSCDIVALFDDKNYRIEVRSARALKNGQLTCTKPSNTDRYDVLALVSKTGLVEYKTQNNKDFTEHLTKNIISL